MCICQRVLTFCERPFPIEIVEVDKTIFNRNRRTHNTHTWSVENSHSGRRTDIQHCFSLNSNRHEGESWSHTSCRITERNEQRKVSLLSRDALSDLLDEE